MNPLDFTNSLFGIAGKSALITGATSGIGRMIAQSLSQAGVKVWIVARKPDDVATIAGETSGRGIVADVSTDEGLATIAAAVGEEPLHILVNNAGMNRNQPLDGEGREDFEAVINVNLTAPFLLIQKLLPNLRAAATREDPARIINIASIAVLHPGPYENFAYAPSKSGLVMLTRHIARHIAPDNITCNAIAPGVFPSRMTEEFINLSGDDGAVPPALASPLGARVGTMEDIGGTVIYLCSRAGAWQTGTLMPVSGGTSVV